ncbi:hypothetical protein D3C87_1382760 [compost metagenome]
MCAAEEGVRRATNGEVLLPGDTPQFFTLFQRKHQRLFRIDVLARFKCGFRHRKMRCGNGEVHHHIDILVGEQVLDGLRDNAEFFRPQLRCIAVEVGAGKHLDALEERRQREISRRDIAASDDADAKISGHDETPKN